MGVTLINLWQQYNLGTKMGQRGLEMYPNLPYWARTTQENLSPLYTEMQNKTKNLTELRHFKYLAPDQ